MSGECPKCGEHCLDCKCPLILERKWISKEEAKEMFPDNQNLDYEQCKIKIFSDDPNEQKIADQMSVLVNYQDLRKKDA